MAKKISHMKAKEHKGKKRHHKGGRRKHTVTKA